MIIGAKIFFAGCILLVFASVVAQIGGKDIPEDAKTFIGGIVLLALIIMAVGGVAWVVML